MTLTRAAPAKINLYLHVGAPLADRRHPLDSLVVFARDAADAITVAPAQDLSLTITGPFAGDLPVADDNLVLHAARLIAAHGGVRAGAAIVLDKHLPIASGIGGGSADAAATLHALNELWRLCASNDDLAALGAQLGADVPACVHGRTARMTGTGEETAPRASPLLHAVLVNPRAPTPTGTVYRMFDAMGLCGALGDPGLPPATAREARSWLAALRNDLEAPATRVQPAIAGVLALLRALAPDALVRMSGSGATCFALVADVGSAESLAREVSAARPDWWVRASVLGAV
jgi:4-diphosphocytidyl-2-C-methyl-D-erythritol kinase